MKEHIQYCTWREGETLMIARVCRQGRHGIQYRVNRVYGTISKVVGGGVNVIGKAK
jgi:hypothetical protein